jgi:hypothetical protein
MMLSIVLSYVAFIMLRYIPSIPSFLRAFIMKWWWISHKAFSASIEMIKWFLSLLLLVCCFTFTDLHFLNHLCMLHPWDEANMLMVNDLSDMLLDTVCHYFIEDFCSNIH